MKPNGIALALGMDDAELARKLADYYKANEDALTDKSVAAFVAARLSGPNVEFSGVPD